MAKLACFLFLLISTSAVLEVLQARNYGGGKEDLPKMEIMSRKMSISEMGMDLNMIMNSILQLPTEKLNCAEYHEACMVTSDCCKPLMCVDSGIDALRWCV